MPGNPSGQLRVELTLDADASNAARARRAIGDLARRGGLDDEGVMAAKTVVTEAFTNAAAHAYPPGEAGPIIVTADCDSGALRISVLDHGRGIRPSPVGTEGHGRLGLLMIAALAELCQIRRVHPSGTELTAMIGAAGSGTADDDARTLVAG